MAWPGNMCSKASPDLGWLGLRCRLMPPSGFGINRKTLGDRPQKRRRGGHKASFGPFGALLGAVCVPSHCERGSAWSVMKHRPSFTIKSNHHLQYLNSDGQRLFEHVFRPPPPPISMLTHFFVIGVRACLNIDIGDAGAKRSSKPTEFKFST